MIGYLSGTLKSTTDNKWLLWVGNAEGSGVGYQVTVPSHSKYFEVAQGDRVELWIYSHVREDIFDLYGFLQQMEKEVFLSLLTVSGVGPKVALALLSGLGSEAIVQALITRDQTKLSSVSGVGKKTAERLVLDLSDSIGKKVKTGSMLVEMKAGSENHTENSGPKGGVFWMDGVLSDAALALQALGFKDSEIVSPLKLLLSNKSEKVSPENLVKEFLKNRHEVRPR